MPATIYSYDPINGQVDRELDEDGNVLVEYTREPDGTLISERRNGVDRQYHFDGQGNTLALTDDSGDVTDTFAYNASGEVTERTGTTPTPYQYHGQQGYYRDSETGDYHVQRRDISPEKSRWYSVDPLRFIDGTNLYTYVRNNPVNLLDPTGLAIMEVVCMFKYHTGPNAGEIVTDFETRLVVVPPVTAATACLPDGTFKKWRALKGDEAKIAGLCAAMAGKGKCAKCNVVACEQSLANLIERIRETWVLNVFGMPIGPNTCQRWVADLQPRLPTDFSINDPCIYNGEQKTLTVTGNPLSPKHVVYKVTLCDGTVFYADNGAIGGSDHIFFPGDIPGNMTED